MLQVRRFALAFVLCLLWSCGQQGQQTPVGPTPPPTGLAHKIEPPSLADAHSATYIGLANGQITMKNGQWEKDKAFAALLEGFLVAGDLDKDGSPESVVIVSEGMRGGAITDYLAVLSRRGGQIINVSTVKLGPPVQIRSAAVEGLNVNLNVIRQGKDDKPCCPTEKATLTFTMPSGSLAKANELVTGTASLGDLAPNEWLLAKFSASEPVTPDTIAYFRVEGATMVGRGPCNSFKGPYAGDATAFNIKVGPLVATKVACVGARQPLEDRFFKQLEAVTHISFSAGRLLMHYPGEKGTNVMVFTSRPVTKTPVGD